VAKPALTGRRDGFAVAFPNAPTDWEKNRIKPLLLDGPELQGLWENATIRRAKNTV
jgi:hypothetical protein